MPYVTQPLMLEAVFSAVTERIKNGLMPTYLLHPRTPLFRSVPEKYAALNGESLLELSSAQENLRIRNATDFGNRFSGSSYSTKIASRGALYFSESEASLVNEHFWYARDKRAYRDELTGYPVLHPSLVEKRILKASISAPMLVADLDVHAGHDVGFLNELQQSAEIQSVMKLTRYPYQSLLEAMKSSTDCSVARGIGLAVATSRELFGLRVGTIRESDRSSDETGNNLVLYGMQDKFLTGLKIESVFCFGYDSTGDFLITEHQTEDIAARKSTT